MQSVIAHLVFLVMCGSQLATRQFLSARQYSVIVINVVIVNRYTNDSLKLSLATRNAAWVEISL